MKNAKFSKARNGAMVLGMALAAAGFGQVPLRAQNTILTGTVKNAAGEPVAGALVKVRSSDARGTYLVVSQAQGRYRTPNLPPGEYSVQAFGGDYQSDTLGPVEVRSGQAASSDLILSVSRKIPPPEKKMTNADYIKLLPEGAGKNLLVTHCVICHSPSKYVTKRWTRVWWENKLAEMRFYLQENPELQRQFNARNGIQAGPLTDQEREVIIDYLVQNFGPGTPPALDAALSTKRVTMAEYAKLLPDEDDKRLLLSRCIICHSPSNFLYKRWDRQKWGNTVDTMHFLLREYQVKSNGGKAPQRAGITDQERNSIADYLARHFGPDAPPAPETPVYDPNQHLPRAFLRGEASKYFASEFDLGSPVMVAAFVVDAQGMVWVSERFSSGFGRFDLKTRTYTRIATPEFSGAGFGSVAIDPQGMIWFTSNNGTKSQWFQYDPKSNQIINTYQVPVPDIPGGDILFNTLRFVPDGSVWAVGTAKHRLVKLDPRTRQVTEYPVRMGQHPFGIAIGGDKMLWYAGDADNELVRVDPSNGKMTPYKLPTANAGPRRVEADRDGNLWAATLEGNKLVKVNYRNAEMAEYAPPSPGGLQGVALDNKRGLVWFSEYGAVKIGRFDPKTNQFVEFPLPDADAQPWMVQVDPTDPNRIWWNSRIGRFGYIEVTE